VKKRDFKKYVGKRVVVKFEFASAPGGMRVFIAKLKNIREDEDDGRDLLIFAKEEWSNTRNLGYEDEQLGHNDVLYICECSKVRKAQQAAILGAML
jgi:hypothetical protein